jgi:UDP-N-acetylmuramate dehydrogenase
MKTTYDTTMNAINIQQNISLAPYTTFNIGGNASYFVEVSSVDGLKEALRFQKANNLDLLILGGGSNMLVSDNGFDGLVIHINIKGFELLVDGGKRVQIQVGAGEIWDDVVARCVDNGWWGIENLSLIPGSNGAAPIQNIGAYGQEIKDVVSDIEVYEIETGQIKILSEDECNFGYRTSIFNTTDKGRYIILNTLYRLQKEAEPNTKYPDVVRYFEEQNIEKPTLQQMREAIIAIRTRKLPDPKKIGNSGSFFKNLVLSEEEYNVLESNIDKNFGAEELSKVQVLKNKFPTPNGIKIPTAFLIDICGLKGLQKGGAKLHEKAALVIINYSGDAKAQDVVEVFEEVRRVVLEKTGMKLYNEPNFVGF